MRFGVTAERDSWALPSVSDEPYGEPQQRGSIRRGEQVQDTMATEAAVQAHDIYVSISSDVAFAFAFASV